MKQEKFNQLSLEKQIEIYNQWLVDSKLTEYILYTNDNDGLETLLERNFFMMSTSDIIEIIYHSINYDISDRLVTFDYEDGFRSLTDNDIKERFENQDFLDYLEGVINYD